VSVEANVVADLALELLQKAGLVVIIGFQDLVKKNSKNPFLSDFYQQRC
jgi:hypothetical protein